jgi:LAS superfamily LD-carboxypeptidase LdcB
LHPDAARAWWRFNRAYESRFGQDVCVTDSYRSLEVQQQVYATQPGLAAAPGTSNHGWGVAADLCGGAESYTSAQHSWLRAKGPRFG